MDRDLSRQEGFLKDGSLAEEILELRSLYLDYLRGEIDTIRSLLARKDLAEIREVGHRLKGSGGSYGLHHISELGEKIQKLQDGTEWDEVETLFHQLEEMYEEIAEGL
jgi:HPt (histidine-containing phosphotransfer) domain-containing protein